MPPLVFAGHIINQLLASGCRVRAAARARKVAPLPADYAKYADQFEAVLVSDIVAEQFSDAIRGVDAVIHTASPLWDKIGTSQELLHVTIEGTLNVVVGQAEKAGVKRIIVTSSHAALAKPNTPNTTVTDKDWNPITLEEAISGGMMTAYAASKTFAEKALWEFADAHPSIDITTFNPPFLYGPFAEGFSLLEPNYYALSTNLSIYRLVTPGGVWPLHPRYADVRDVAKAHVLALKAPLSSESNVGRKRFPIAALDDFDFRGFLDLIKEKCPELAHRLTKVEPPSFPSANIKFDVDRLQQVLGMSREDLSGLEDTMLGTVDQLIAMEKSWISEGYEINVPNE